MWLSRVVPSLAFVFVLISVDAAAAQTQVVRVAPDRQCGLYSHNFLDGCGPLEVGDYVEHQRRVWHTLLHFDFVSAVPPQNGIVSARLRLHGPAYDQVTAHGITADWTHQATWETRDGANAWATDGGDYARDPRIPAQLDGPAAPTWTTWDLTRQVNQWRAGHEPNHGALLRIDDSAGPPNVQSAEYTGAGPNAPYLEITHAPDTVPPTLALEGVLYDERATQLIPRLYDLSIGSTDGLSGVDRVEVKLDGSLVYTGVPDVPCEDVVCDVDVDDYLLDASTFSGDHLVEVMAYDQAGNVGVVSWTANFDGVGEPFTPSPPVGQDPDGNASFSMSRGSAFPLGCPMVTRARAHGGVDLLATTIRHGYWRDESGRRGPESTEFLDDGSYIVTRCASSGKLISGGWFGPVRVPGGSAILPLSRTVATPNGYSTVTVEYLSPDDPTFISVWRARREQIQRAVPQPTQLRP
jgi:hypothetical protein